MLLLVLFGLSFAAFGVSAVAGGGAGLVLLPVLRLLLPVEQTPAALSIGTAASSLARLHAFTPSRLQKTGALGRCARLRTCRVALSASGAWLLSRFQPAYVDLLIAVFLLSNLPAALGRKRPSGSAHAPSTNQLRIIAALAGFISGFTGSVGLLFNGFYRRLGLGKDALIATPAANEIGLQVLRVGLYSAFGLMKTQTIFAGVLLGAAATSAAYAMQRLVPRLNEDTFRRISDVSMVMAGLAMLTLSSGQILKLHRGWVQTARVVDDREFQLYWQGHLHFSFELENGWQPILERSLSPNQYATKVLSNLPAGSQIASVEEILSFHGRRPEVVYAPSAHRELQELEVHE